MLMTVDTGGTKTLVAGFGADGRLVASTKFPTSKNHAEYLDAVATAVTEIAGPEPLDALVMALPGIIKDGVAVWCKNLDWHDFPAQASLEARFPGVPVLIENDANMAGLSETRLRQPLPHSSLYVTFSTGVGTSVITDGRLNHGFMQSEGGHATIEYKGEFTYWESIASGRQVYETYGKYARDIHDTAAWRDIADRMSRGLMVLIPFMQPDVVIIGGSMGSFFDRYGHYLKAILDERLLAGLARPEIAAAVHPEEAVVYGCYYYALDELAATTA